ncbi:uncharacterized protein [Venturia canescens]|uniref:uncharacterized protein isoform X2 n=1 Tax=Venturia canescens TaxID=32260 RepID=UPI001C9C0BA8|nr:uncharacterized protein LOC122411667 isoform X2 [Venturia canescens]
MHIFFQFKFIHVFTATVVMDNVEVVLDELYDKLLQIKYPGVAKATRNDMQDIVLACENRVFLLSWLFGKVSDVNGKEFTDKPNESTVVQWYSEMGISDDPEVLMGRVPIKNQIFTLKRLLLFINSVCLVDQPCNNGQVDVLDLYKLTQKLSYNGALQVLEHCRDRLNKTTVNNQKSYENQNDLLANGINRTVDNHDDHAEPENELSQSESNPDTSNCSDLKERISKFLTAFENASTWSKPDNCESKAVPSKPMDHCIQNVYSNMTTLKESFQSKDQIANCATIEPLKRQDMALDCTIENIVIAIEEYHRLQNND